MNIRILASAFATTLALSTTATFAASPEFIDGAGTLTPTAATPTNCKVCTAPYKGTITTTLGGATIVLTATGTITGYVATALPDGSGGVCVRVIGNFVFTDASGKDSLKSETFGTHCTISKTGYNATDVGTYVNEGGTGIFAGSKGVGNISSETTSSAAIVLTIHGTL
jgi:hypothetical protein